MFFLELFAGLLSYAYYYQVERDLERNLKPVLEEEYSVDPGVTDAIDVMQREVDEYGDIVPMHAYQNNTIF